MSCERTIVGIPFSEQEDQQTLDTALRNIDACLNNLQVDAEVVVLVNGVNTMKGQLSSYAVDRSQYNADIRVQYGKERGQVTAINQIVADAAQLGYEKIFITDADIYRFPNSMRHMWEQASTPLTGAHHVVYPIEVIEASGRSLTSEEAFMYTLFEAEKHPNIQQIIREYHPNMPMRVKGSLMLVDTKIGATMHETQSTVSDSVINRIVGKDKKRIAENAVFMHWGRISLQDHITARMRHYRGAAMRGDLEGFTESQLVYSETEAIAIAEKIKQELPNGNQKVSFFLLSSALRQRLSIICPLIASDYRYVPRGDTLQSIPSLADGLKYEEAFTIIDTLLTTIDWDCLATYGKTPPGVTQQELPRHGLDIEPFMKDSRYKAIILDNLGVGKNIIL